MPTHPLVARGAQGPRPSTELGLNGGPLTSSGAGRFPRLLADPWRRRAALLLAGLTLVRLVMLATVRLANGEAYYAMWARFPSWSYYDHPPLVAWMTWLMTRASPSAFAVRLGPVLC